MQNKIISYLKLPFAAEALVSTGLAELGYRYVNIGELMALDAYLG